MKILFVSMPSIHVIRWIENLKDTNFELYWFDVLDRGSLESIESVHQFVNWKKRKTKRFRGEYYLSKKMPKIFQKLNPFLETTANEALETIILEIQPDLVHSFEMQSCSYSILKTMQKYTQIKWLYSSWGSDLYYYQQFSLHRKKIKSVLNRVDFLHTDCLRDYKLANQLGFKGKHLGVIPGGTGYRVSELELHKKTIEERKIILVKGYEHYLGRGLNCIKALQGIQNSISGFEVVVFGAHSQVIDYIKTNNLAFKVFDRHELSHQSLLELMGNSLIYVGNSISDGMPNTLLEAIVMGAFPIQSNPGGVTEEIIENGVNGFLIQNPEDIKEIAQHVLTALNDVNLQQTAYLENIEIAKIRLEYSKNKSKLINWYQIIC